MSSASNGEVVEGGTATFRPVLLVPKGNSSLRNIDEQGRFVNHEVFRMAVPTEAVAVCPEASASGPAGVAEASDTGIPDEVPEEKPMRKAPGPIEEEPPSSRARRPSSRVRRPSSRLRTPALESVPGATDAEEEAEYVVTSGDEVYCEWVTCDTK